VLQRPCRQRGPCERKRNKEGLRQPTRALLPSADIASCPPRPPARPLASRPYSTAPRFPSSVKALLSGADLVKTRLRGGRSPRGLRRAAHQPCRRPRIRPAAGHSARHTAGVIS
jgi:hypothetical protein